MIRSSASSTTPVRKVSRQADRSSRRRQVTTNKGQPVFLVRRDRAVRGGAYCSWSIRAGFLRMRVLLRLGDHCARLLNERMRRLPCKLVQMDEIWTFVGKEERRVRHQSLRVTPAMASGAVDSVWEIGDLLK